MHVLLCSHHAVIALLVQLFSACSVHLLFSTCSVQLLCRYDSIITSSSSSHFSLNHHTLSHYLELCSDHDLWSRWIEHHFRSSFTISSWFVHISIISLSFSHGFVLNFIKYHHHSHHFRSIFRVFQVSSGFLTTFLKSLFATDLRFTRDFACKSHFPRIREIFHQNCKQIPTFLFVYFFFYF